MWAWIATFHPREYYAGILGGRRPREAPEGSGTTAAEPAATFMQSYDGIAGC